MSFYEILSFSQKVHAYLLFVLLFGSLLNIAATENSTCPRFKWVDAYKNVADFCIFIIYLCMLYINILYIYLVIQWAVTIKIVF